MDSLRALRADRGRRESRIATPCGLVFVLAILAGSVTADDALTTAIYEVEPAETSELERRLEERVRQNPDDGSAWRLLGHAKIDRGDWDGAMAALRTAIELDSLCVAAYFDYGRAAAALGKKDAAAKAWKNVTTLAPQSDYAEQVPTLLQQLAAQEGVNLASYEIRTFDGSNLTPLILPKEKPGDPDWRDDVDVRLDIGAQYNSNVSLAPSSREINTGRRASAQGTASFTMNWSAINVDGFRLGPMIDTDFTLNERNLARFDLQSYRPGVFADGIWDAGDFTLRPRIAYLFDHDEFNGSTFGNKHTLAFSAGAYWTPQQISTAYYSIDHNNLANDGAIPNLSSQDGWSNTIGVVHDFIDPDWFWRSFRFGADFQNVNTEGANYRFFAFSVYSQTVLVLVPTVHLKLRSGYAFRDYPDFDETPSRNTNIIRTGIELRKYFDAGLSAAIYSQYDRFASRNDQFDRSRYLSGAVVTWEY